MKIGRFQPNDAAPFWGILSDDERRVTRLSPDFSTWAPELATALTPPRAWLAESYDLAHLAIRAPLEPESRVWGVGVNYLKHIAGHFSEPPADTPGFMKPASAIVDPGGVSRNPSGFAELDYEIELVLVVARQLEAAMHPMAALLGYTIGNDGSVRDVGHVLGPDLYSMKAQDGMSAVGPWVATLGSIGTINQPDLLMTTHVNGELRQKDSTREMIFPVEWIMRFINERNEVRPGDLIFTGTIAGTCADAGYAFLQAGDKVRMTIEGIGTLDYSVGEKDHGR